MRRVSASCRAAAALGFVTVAVSTVPCVLRAQANNGAIRGQVADRNRVPVPSVTLRISGVSLSTMSNSAGVFVLEHVPVGQRLLVVRRPGFALDSIRVDVRAGVTITQDVVLPGVSTERDEGEGKFVQIRGTEPRLSNVAVNGVHIPGTQTGSRVAKLDDIPTDLLGGLRFPKP